MTNFIIMVGYPGCGKSTAVKKMAATKTNLAVCETDYVAKELIERYNWPQDQSDWTPGQWFKLHMATQERAKSYLEAGHDVIYDATNLRSADIKVMADIARKTNSKLEIHLISWPSFQEWRARLQTRPQGEIYWWKIILKMSEGAMSPMTLPQDYVAKITALIE